jgi:hypothetical protein
MGDQVPVIKGPGGVAVDHDNERTLSLVHIVKVVALYV